MPRLILPKDDLKRMIRERRRFGGDRYDEVWNGVYSMSPLADIEHQYLATRLAALIDRAVEDRFPGLFSIAGTNVSDRSEDWTKNFRCPDVAVFLPGNPAEDRDTHWFGGPDFAVEILSRGDRARKKLGFYARVGVRELLLIDRDPWRLELYRLADDPRRLEPAGAAEPHHVSSIESAVLNLVFRLVPGEPRPRVELTRTTDGQTWLA